MLRHINFQVTRCILIESPGLVKDEFFEFTMQWPLKTGNRILLENRSKFLLFHSSSGFKHSLTEVLSDPAVTCLMADTKAASEVRALHKFYTYLQAEPSRAFYGWKQSAKLLKHKPLIRCCSPITCSGHKVFLRERNMSIWWRVCANLAVRLGSFRVFTSLENNWLR